MITFAILDENLTEVYAFETSDPNFHQQAVTLHVFAGMEGASATRNNYFRIYSP